MTPPDEPPSNPYDPNWPKPETPPPSAGNEPPASPYGQPTDAPPTQPYGQPYGQQSPPSGEQASPCPPYGQQQQQPWGRAPQGQPGWGQQQPYGRVPYGTPMYGAMQPKHPSATTAMVLGIGALGGMFVCGVPIVLAPFAWMVGGRAVKEIDANPGRWSGRDRGAGGPRHGHDRHRTAAARGDRARRRDRRPGRLQRERRPDLRPGGGLHDVRPVQLIPRGCSRRAPAR
ncbi:hypothetical protein [Nocardioides sp. B-3]|uniref:hypothetical protein n=1 Tax=Nocardioides sp. B-3 TaxID=2895565 RepID=UPI00215346C7|nr:hypothetical protein [Nocardioides sp. B-3]UUZ60690.1 hypothetical protein LP418_07720 [Nocardioides sp. B-3]